MNIREHLGQRISAVLRELTGLADAPALVAPAARPEFGDYQANGVMAAAKAVKSKPRDLAAKLLEKLDLSDLAEKVEIAGPGFINIHLKRSWLAERLGQAAADPRLGAPAPAKPQRVVVDYSAPNLAKEMHVGHLRSSIIGDALARTLEFLGHTVIRQNHVGDWGTQFGMLIAFLRQEGQLADSMHIADLEEFYRRAKQRFDADPAFADAARRAVVAVQSGDPEHLKAWRMFIAESMTHCREVYRRLGVTLTDADIRGESAYNDDLPRVVADLDKAGLLKESQGAMCVFLDQFKGKDGAPLPLIVQKSDEGYLYATTDLAAVRYRVGVLHAGRILYVTDSRQALHFAQMFAVARAAGFAPPAVALEHVAFGTMMGPDGKPFKTRAGGTVKLIDLLNEAEQKAFDLVSAKNPELAEQQRRDIARIVGIGAVKYADLAQNRSSDYVFSFEKMLSLEGNTAPYMQYAYARIRSIFRKAEGEGVGRQQAAAAIKDPAGRPGMPESAVEAPAVRRGLQDEPAKPPAGIRGAEPGAGVPIVLNQPSERALGLKLLQFPETIQTVADECLPNLLCAYLYDLASAFTGFYEHCPVLQSPEPVRSQRLALCAITAGTIKQCLNLLGIDTAEQM